MSARSTTADPTALTIDGAAATLATLPDSPDVRTAAAAWGGAGMSAVQAAQRCVVVQPAGHAITGHPRAFSVLPRRDDWPWQDDFAALDAPNLLPQGSHDAFDSPTLDCLYIGFTVHRAGGLS